jgi:uncharacterized protein
MSFEALPPCAAWRHTGSRDGFEVAFFRHDESGYRILGDTTAVEGGRPWAVRYDITLDRGWLTRRASVRGRSARGETRRRVERDDRGRWLVDGVRRPDLDGCVDVDLESSAMTNTIPVHRLALAVGSSARAPAAYVRADGLRVERLEQGYERVTSDSGHAYAYEAPAFSFACRLDSDAAGLVVSYPGIAVRAL